MLWGSSLAWMFDGYEQYAIVIALPSALRTLLRPEQLHRASLYFGIVLCVTLVGWGIGGLVGGRPADYVGRKRMMMLSVLVYAAFSGFSALSQSFRMLAVFRFMTARAIGSEWSTGVTLIAETLPDEATAQRIFGIGYRRRNVRRGRDLVTGLTHFHLAESMNWSNFIFDWRFAGFARALSSQGSQRIRVLDHGRQRTPLAGDRSECHPSRPRQRATSLYTCCHLETPGEPASELASPRLALAQHGDRLVGRIHAAAGIHSPTAKPPGPVTTWGSRAGDAVSGRCHPGLLCIGFPGSLHSLGRRPVCGAARIWGALVYHSLDSFCGRGSLTLFLSDRIREWVFHEGCCYAWMAIYVGEMFSSSVRVPDRLQLCIQFSETRRSALSPSERA